MVMEISVSSNIKQVTKRMGEMRKQIPYATSRALNTIAYQLQQELGKEIDKKIDRPTPFTRKSWLYLRSTKAKLTAIVYAKQIQARYLSIQETGGTRTPLRRGIPIPVGQKKNQYGNIPRTAVARMYNATNGKYFSGIPKGGRFQTPGIYQRLGKGGRAGIRLMVKWQDTAGYRKRTDFSGVATRVIRQRFEGELKKQIANAIKSAK
jgi:hypothetical protein